MKTRTQLLEEALDAAKKMVVYLETTYGTAPREMVLNFDAALAALDAAKEELDTVTLPTNKQINDAADQCLREQYPTQDTVTLPRDTIATAMLLLRNLQNRAKLPETYQATYNDSIDRTMDQLTAAMQQPTKPV